MSDTKTSLDVKESLNKARWVLPETEFDLVARIARQHGLPEIIARLLCVRDVPEERIEAFLYPTLKRDFPDPFKMADMRLMAEYMAQAIADGRKFGIFGDFDVDGATSTAILVRFFRHLGIEVPFYIPDRLKEGYGPNVNAFQSLKEQGAEIVLICDCGITAFDTIAAGREMGLDIVVFDHHQAEPKLPDANFVIDPKREDDSSGYDMLAACGVVFLSCVAINAVLRDNGYFSKHGLKEVPMINYLEILALGTVCDMVPLTGPNRLFVRSGFEQMAKRRNTGIRALLEVAKVNGEPNTYHAGFVLGPRINAGSRVHKAWLGAKLLSTDDEEEARNIAFTLNDCNDMRKEIQAEMFSHAVNMVEDGGLQDAPVIVVGHEDWHPGLSGLVAGNLKEKYGKPAVAITYAENEQGVLEGRGSGRSVEGVNIGASFIDARNEGLLVKGGGHAMAAGFTLEPDKLDAFKAYLADHVSGQMAGGVSLSETRIDGILSVRGASPEFVKLLQNHFGPFGQDHEEPVFVLPNVRLHNVDIIGKDHVRALVSDWEGGPRLKTVAFKAAETPLGQAMLQHGSGRPFHLAGYFKLDTWNGNERAEMHITDGAYAISESAQDRISA